MLPLLEPFNLRDDLPGLGLTINEAALSRFVVIE
jgi:hypothetical protein